MYDELAYMCEIPEWQAATAELDDKRMWILLDWDTTPVLLRENDEKNLKAHCNKYKYKSTWAMRWMKMPEYKLAREVLSKAKGERHMRHRIVLDALEAKASQGDLKAMAEFRRLYPEKLTSMEAAFEELEAADVTEMSIEDLERLAGLDSGE